MINGRGRIADVAGKFKKMIDQVQLGIKELDASFKDNTKQIDSLVNDNLIIQAEIGAARELEGVLSKFVPSGVK